MRKIVLSFISFCMLLTVFCLSAGAKDGTPVAYYTFDYGNLSDFSGNGYHGTAAGGRNRTYEKDA